MKERLQIAAAVFVLLLMLFIEPLTELVLT